MRKSKYVNKQFGEWTCYAINVARVMPKKTLDNRKAKRPGHCTYAYSFVRITSDNKCNKFITISAKDAARIYKGLLTVEEVCLKREQKTKKALPLPQQLRYNFVNN